MISKEKLRRVGVAWACVEHYLKNWQDCSSGEWDGMSYHQLPIWSSSCPACWVYMFSWRAKPDCKGCPVERYTGRPSCKGTPWYRMRWAYSGEADFVLQEYEFLVLVALKESAELMKTNRPQAGH